MSSIHLRPLARQSVNRRPNDQGPSNPRTVDQDEAIKVSVTRQATNTATLNGEIACSVEWDDQRADVLVGQTGPGEGWFRSHGETVPFHVWRNGETLQVWVKGEVHSFVLVDSSPRRSAEAGSRRVHEDLVAPMPGTVLRVEVAEGDAFDAHQPLVILESMKMEMTLTLPHGGRIEKITCQVGQLVDMNAVLAILAEPGDG